MSPFPFLLLGLRVWVCFPKSCFVLAAAFAWFHFTGLAATFAWFHFAGPSLPPSLFRGREARESRMPLLPLSLPTPPRAPACVSMKCIPPTTLESLGGVHLLRGSLLRRSFPASLPSSAAGVASRRVARRRRLRAELGRLGGRRGGVPGGRRQRPVLGTFESLVGSHLAAACILSLPSGASARPPSGGL